MARSILQVIAVEAASRLPEESERLTAITLPEKITPAGLAICVKGPRCGKTGLKTGLEPGALGISGSRQPSSNPRLGALHKAGAAAARRFTGLCARESSCTTKISKTAASRRRHILPVMATTSERMSAQRVFWETEDILDLVHEIRR